LQFLATAATLVFGTIVVGSCAGVRALLALTSLEVEAARWPRLERNPRPFALRSGVHEHGHGS
jgi:hypothetical protein